MTPRRTPDARELDAGSPPRPTTSSDVIEGHDQALGAPCTDDALDAAAASPLEGAAGGSMLAWVITTQSGSLYIVVRSADDVWWLGGKNRPNSHSVALPPQLYQIEPPQPWPPVIGAPLTLLASRRLAYGDPRRAPGGGKLTSAVQLVEAMSVRAALERVGGHDGN